MQNHELYDLGKNRTGLKEIYLMTRPGFFFGHGPPSHGAQFYHSSSRMNVDWPGIHDMTVVWHWTPVGEAPMGYIPCSEGIPNESTSSSFGFWLIFFRPSVAWWLM